MDAQLLAAAASVCALLALTAVPRATAECQWSRTLSFPPSRWMSAAAASTGDAVAFCGGTFVDNTTGRQQGDRNQCASYSVGTGVWHVLPNMTARSSPAAAVADGRLYVFGGEQQKQNASHSDPDPTTKLALVESISISKDGHHLESNWRKEADMPFGPRESPRAVSVGQHGILIAGGFYSTTSQGVFKFEYYNTTHLFKTGEYTRLPDMPFKRSNLELVYDASADTVWAFGGGENDPSYATCASLYLGGPNGRVAKAWIAGPSLVNPRSWAAAGVLPSSTGGGGTLIITGGMDGRFSPTAETDILAISPSSSWAAANCDLPVAAGFISGDVTATGHFVVFAGSAYQGGGFVLTTAP